MAKDHYKENMLRLDQQLCFPLYAASRLVVQAYSPHLNRLGLTYPQYLVMLVLWEEDGASVKEIGARLFLDSGTLTPILKKLERLRFVRRQRSQVDDRAVLNFVTEEGFGLKPKAISMVENLACETGIPFDEAVHIRDHIYTLIRKFCQVTDKRSDQDKETETELLGCVSALLGKREGTRAKTFAEESSCN